MIFVGIDDTDTLDDPGTNQLARHLVRELADSFQGESSLGTSSSKIQGCPAPGRTAARRLNLSRCPNPQRLVLQRGFAG